MQYPSAIEAAWTTLGYTRTAIALTVEIWPIHEPGNEYVIVNSETDDVSHAPATVSKLWRNMERPHTGKVPTQAAEGTGAAAARLRAPPMYRGQRPMATPQGDDRGEERRLLAATMTEEQVQAVMTNDFDAMTYCTYHESYIHAAKGNTKAGWCDLQHGPEGEVPQMPDMRRPHVRPQFRPGTCLPRKLLRCTFKQGCVIRVIRQVYPREKELFALRLHAAAVERGLIVRNEAELTLREAEHDTPEALQAMFVALITMLPDVNSLDLLSKFHSLMEASPRYLDAAAQQHPHTCIALLHSEQDRKPVHATSKWNRLLHDMDELLRQRGLDNLTMGLPPPLELFNLRARGAVERYRDMHYGDGNVVLVHERLQAMAANPQQLHVFWTVMRWLRQHAPERNATVEEWDNKCRRTPTPSTPCRHRAFSSSTPRCCSGMLDGLCAARSEHALCYHSTL